MRKDLLNKNVIITGAASGIGRLMALDFAAEGSNIALVDVDEKNLSCTEAEVLKYNVRTESYYCDVSNSEQIVQTAKAIKRDFGAIDILVNNAGVASGSWCYETEYAQMKKTIDVNLLGSMWFTRQFLPEMMEHNSGHIVNISSAMGLQAVPRMSDYVATKFGLIGYSDTLRLEMKKHGYQGVKVTVVCPSGIDTEMFKGYRAPWLSPLLKPEDVSRKIIKAVKKEKTYLKLPFIVKTIPFLRGLPAGMTDKMADMLGLSQSMDHLKR